MNNTIIPKNATIIIGFSGGPDSCYLLLMLKKIQQSYNITLIAAHLDHEWREESNQDLIWCQRFCNEHNIPFVGQKASQLKFKPFKNGSKEQEARLLRQFFFESILSQYNTAYIALAHHQDDQLETFFIRLARGASISGLSGMKDMRDHKYLRPLLNVSKTQILSYLNDNNIAYLTDPSNQDLQFLRNRIRHTLIPLLPSIDSRMKQHTIATMHHFALVDDFLHQTTEQIIQSITIAKKPLTFATDQFLQLHPIIQQRTLLYLLIQNQIKCTPKQTLFAEIVRFLQSKKHSKHQLFQTHFIKKSKNSFSIIQQ